MMRRFMALVGSAALVLTAFAGEARAKTTGGTEKLASFTDNMEKLTSTVGLTEAQQKKMESLKATRDAALKKWDDANQKQITAIEGKLAKLTGKKDARAKGQLDRQLKVLWAGRSRVQANGEKEMFAVLTREQRGKWNGPVLAGAVLKEYSSLKLNDAQKAKAQEICLKRGEGISAPVDEKLHDVTFKAVKQQAYASVLTPAQRKEYDKTKKPSSPTRTKTTKTRN